MTPPFPGSLASYRSGSVPIEDYAVIGDGRTVALIARDGQIDWLPLPDLDSTPVFAALLDPDRGGCIALAPTEVTGVERRYLPGTNVLETTFTTETGSVRVVDALTVGMSGPLPWNELARRVEVLDGEVDLEWRVAPGGGLGRATPWTHRLGNGQVTLHSGPTFMGLGAFDIGDVDCGPREARGRARLAAGATGLLVLTSSDADALWLPEREQVESRLERTVRRWRDWSSEVAYDGRWQEAVCRSALALKLLIFSPTGAIAAAGTTSLPESPGGDLNWDYRFMWIRDASFTADALMSLGLSEEVHGVVAWLLDVVRSTAPDLHVLYTLAGGAAADVTEIDVPGWNDSRPVRAGNTAIGQRQLGNFGDLFDTVWTYVCRQHVLDTEIGRILAMLADRCCDTWRLPDSGLWELGDQQHYTVSKMDCWVALDRALKLVDAGQIPAEHPHRWEAERDAIRAWVDENCWSEVKGSYTFYAGTDDLDAAVLLAGQTGFDRGDRLAGTVDAVLRELADGPLVWRYSGQQSKEGAFIACSFWLATAMTHIGRTDEAKTLMDGAVGLANDVGLFSEEYGADGHQLGNTPQALSHLALINAATAIRDAESSRRDDED